MPWTSASAVLAMPSGDMPGWLWLVVSIIPDVLLVATLVGLWLHHVSSRRHVRREADEPRGEAAAEPQTADVDVARRLRIVAENASDVVMETDNDGVVRWITTSVLQRIGRRPEDLVGTPYAHLVHPDERDTVRSMERQVQEGMATDAEVRLRSADGSYRWFSLSLRPIFDDRHQVVRRVGGWRDIHGEVQARAVAATERQRLHAQMASMINPLMLGEPVRDPAGRVVDFVVADANPPACAFFKAERQRVQGRRFLELMPHMVTTGLIARFAAAADTGRPLTLDDFPLPMPDGSVHWLDVRAVRADGWISFVWSDNTEKRAALARIAASEEQFRLLAENSLDVVVRIDANDKVVWVSPSVTSVLGWSGTEFVGRSGLDFLATEEARQQYRRDKARVFAGEGAVSRSQIHTKTGEVHWMEAHSSPFRMPNGRIDGLIAALRIIDAEVLAEQALDRRARIDDLTGLLNRKELMDRLDELVTHGDSGVAVLWCDIDRFKETNDVHGHAAGDAVLEALGARIRGCLPTPDDLGGRIGGDELMVALRGVHDIDEAVLVAERLRCAAAEPIPFAGDAIVATLSIGATLALPDEGIDAILARADDAMYEAKAQGRNRVVAIGAPARVAS